MGGETGFRTPADARVFLGRLTHLDAAALVRLRPAGTGRTALWGRLPWGVLVTREVGAAAPAADVTVAAAALLRAGDGGLPERRDAGWRWPLPPDPGTVVEEVPAARLREVGAAAAVTLREVARDGLAGRPVGSRMLREALLDHVPVVVQAPGAGRVEVPQRLVQGVLRMGFVGDGDAEVRVRLAAGRWVGLAAPFGTAWLPPPGSLVLRPAPRVVG
jgi:hypothetical protein